MDFTQNHRTELGEPLATTQANCYHHALQMVWGPTYIMTKSESVVQERPGLKSTSPVSLCDLSQAFASVSVNSRWEVLSTS